MLSAFLQFDYFSWLRKNNQLPIFSQDFCLRKHLQSGFYCVFICKQGFQFALKKKLSSLVFLLPFNIDAFEACDRGMLFTVSVASTSCSYCWGARTKNFLVALTAVFFYVYCCMAVTAHIQYNIINTKIVKTPIKWCPSQAVLPLPSEGVRENLMSKIYYHPLEEFVTDIIYL